MKNSNTLESSNRFRRGFRRDRELNPSTLKIALLAGTLGQGGAERQLLYMARALKALGADVRVYCPYQGEYYESKLVAENIPVIWLGSCSNTGVRLMSLAAKLFRFRPHVIQACHFYLNFPANLLGWLFGAIHIAASRSDLTFELQVCRPWGIWGIRTATTLVANSKTSREKAIHLGVHPEKVLVLPNVIDLEEFDRATQISCAFQPNSPAIWAAAVGTITENKNFELFLRALARARLEVPLLQGFLVGDGPVQDELKKLSSSVGLEHHFKFLGRRSDVAALLKQANLLVLSSRLEGCPNVILEAMAAGLPVITTPAGEAADLVNVAHAGFVVEHGDLYSMARRLVQLARSPQLRSELGNNGRTYVEQHHAADKLGENLLRVYRNAAGKHTSNSLDLGAVSAPS